MKAYVIPERLKPYLQTVYDTYNKMKNMLNKSRDI